MPFTRRSVPFLRSSPLGPGQRSQTSISTLCVGWDQGDGRQLDRLRNGHIMTKGLFVLGFGGHARSVGDIALSSGFNDLTFVEEHAKDGEEFAGFPVVKVLPDNAFNADWFVFPGSGDNARRQAQCES